jgi:hypothetical protein
MMKLLTKISLTLMNMQLRTVHECEKWDNVLKTWRKERHFLISLQLPHYNLRTIHWLQMDRTLCTNLTLTFLIPQNTEMGFQKILILCSYDERQMCPADNFLFMINQSGVKCEARETPHCILTTTSIAKHAEFCHKVHLQQYYTARYTAQTLQRQDRHQW